MWVSGVGLRLDQGDGRKLTLAFAAYVLPDLP